MRCLAALREIPDWMKHWMEDFSSHFSRTFVGAANKKNGGKEERRKLPTFLIMFTLILELVVTPVERHGCPGVQEYSCSVHLRRTIPLEESRIPSCDGEYLAVGYTIHGNVWLILAPALAED